MLWLKTYILITFFLRSPRASHVSPMRGWSGLPKFTMPMARPAFHFIHRPGQENVLHLPIAKGIW